MNGLNFPNLGYIYKYDQLNRLTGQRSYDGLDTTGNEWTSAAVLEDYKENIHYDPNGNILTYERYATQNNSPNYHMDSLTYSYTGGTNRLDHVNDAINASNYDQDIDDQDTLNYLYDAIGNLSVDIQDSLSYGWNTSGKLFEVFRSKQADQGFSIYSYDPMGNRIDTYSEHFNLGEWDYEIHVRDAQGNIMATYTWDNFEQDYKLRELSIYGSSRLGILKADTMIFSLSTILTPPDFYSAWSGRKMYELTNHLGNVLATVTDKKVLFDNNNDNIADWSVPEIATANDYYPFGMLMPGRNSDSTYRFGFNQKENLDYVKGEGRLQDYGMRTYDPRLGKFLSLDPLTKDFPDLSPYQFASNTPIMAIDLDGLEAWIATQKWSKKDKAGFSEFAKTQLKTYTESKLKDDCADLAIRLISEYAFDKKLPLFITTANGKIISNETTEFNGIKIRTGSKEDFIRVAQDFTNAEALAKNTYPVDNKQSQPGDLRIMLENDFHHTMIISDPVNNRVVYGGSSAGTVVEGPDFSAMTNNAAGIGNASRFNVFKEFEGKNNYSPPPIDDILEGTPQH